MVVGERLTISFADTERGIQGVAIDGAGSLLKLGEEPVASGPPQFERDGDAYTVRAGDAWELRLEPLAPAGTTVIGEVTLHHATGTVGSARIDGLALLGRASGESSGVAVERSLAILFDASLAFALGARRPAGAGGHGDELLEAVAFRGEPPAPATFERPLMSSTYGSDGELAHVGMELWETEESDRPTRIGGEAQAHGVVAHPDGASTHVTFVAWHHDGRHGLGSYAITKPA